MDSKSTSSKPFVFPVMKKAIEDLFIQCSIKKEDIEAFQDRYWEQLVPNFSQALKLLDIHGVPRHNILWTINDRLLEAIRTNVELKGEDSDQKKCQKLWQKLIKTGMVYIHHPYMRSLIMQVLGKMTVIKERHVNLIVDNQYLYDDAPLPVLRHIWIAHPRKFQEELDKVIAGFQNSWSDALMDALLLSITATASSTTDLVPLLYWPPRRRRRDASIVRIVAMIGDGQMLYDKAVHILREECARSEKATVNQTTGGFFTRENSRESLAPVTKRRRLYISESTSDEKSLVPDFPAPGSFVFSPAFLPNQAAVTSALLSTIRFDLLMSLNEAKIDRLCVPDRIHRFVWCLDACVRNRRIDQRHASGLAYHVKSQRQRAKRADAAIDEQRDLEVDELTSHVEGSSKRHLASGRSKHAKANKHTSKKPDVDESSTTDEVDGCERFMQSELLERDIHMACRDPWVMYTICISLVRYTLNGLYEYKLPRDIPEIGLLVHFLLCGIGEDFQSSLSQQAFGCDKDRSDSRQRPQNPADPVDEILATSKSLSDTLICHILPAVAQLQVLVWRAQVAEEIVALSNHIWPSTSPSGSASLLSPTPSGMVARRLSVSGTQDIREVDQPPAALQKQITNASQATNVNVPVEYFVHPIGYLLLQYHALFALERGELAVLRALLKAAANATHQQLRASKLAGRTTPVKVPPGSPPKSPVGVIGTHMYFRWRPEVLQALVLGIARLPCSAPAFVDTNHIGSRSMGAGSSAMDANGLQLDERVRVSDSGTSLDQSSSKTGSGATADTSGSQISTSTVVGTLSSELRSTSPVLVTRVELAMILKASLTLTTDVQLLALAQLALLLPRPYTTTPSAPNILLPLTDSGPLESSATTERERCIAFLSRHVSINTDTESTSGDSIQPPVSGAGDRGERYKSSDSRVLLALDTLRKDSERVTTFSLPLSGVKSVGGAHSTPFTSIPSGMTSNRAIGPQSHLDAPWSGNTLRSPTRTSKSVRATTVTPRSEFRGGSSGGGGGGTISIHSTPYLPPCSSFMGSQLPMGTPLTNPGLMGVTPNLNNSACGQSAVPHTPRRPFTPPPEFRPSSPLHTSLTLDQLGSHIGGFSGTDLNINCSSPLIHRSAQNGRGLNEFTCPRSPSPSNK